jgi:hypothetical protein
MFSSNLKTTIFGFTLVLLSAGSVKISLGGETSLFPPVGVTGLAHCQRMVAHKKMLI